MNAQDILEHLQSLSEEDRNQVIAEMNKSQEKLKDVVKEDLEFLYKGLSGLRHEVMNLMKKIIRHEDRLRSDYYATEEPIDLLTKFLNFDVEDGKSVKSINWEAVYEYLDESRN